MKRLIIMRHGKSSWNQTGIPDHDRPLKKRGKNDAPRMGRLLLESGILPDQIITSSAKRARATAILVAKSFDFSGQIEETSYLYHADPRQYIEKLNQLHNDIQTAMVVGHNPGMEDLIEELTGTWKRFPTAAIAVVDIPIQDWSELDLGVDGILRKFWLPKEIDH